MKLQDHTSGLQAPRTSLGAGGASLCVGPHDLPQSVCFKGTAIEIYQKKEDALAINVCSILVLCIDSNV